MCFGGGSRNSSENTETFDSALSILNRFKYGSKITQDKYIDPLGYEYNRSMVSCVNCIFSYGLEKCVLYKDQGYSDADIKHIMNKLLVHNEQNCDYFLIDNFSEGDNEDEIARDAVKKIYNKIY
jgi:hypothetical protein